MLCEFCAAKHLFPSSPSFLHVLWQIVVSCVVWCIHNAFWHSTQFVTLKSKTFAVFCKRNGFAVLWCVSPNEGIGDQESEMVARCLNVVSVRICSTVGGNSFSCSKWPNDTTVHRDTNVVQGPYHINHLGLIHIALPKPANQANQDIHTRTQPPSLLTSAVTKLTTVSPGGTFKSSTTFSYISYVKEEM